MNFSLCSMCFWSNNLHFTLFTLWSDYTHIDYFFNVHRSNGRLIMRQFWPLVEQIDDFMYGISGLYCINTCTC